MEAILTKSPCTIKKTDIERYGSVQHPDIKIDGEDEPSTFPGPVELVHNQSLHLGLRIATSSTIALVLLSLSPSDCGHRNLTKKQSPNRNNKQTLQRGRIPFISRYQRK